MKLFSKISKIVKDEITLSSKPDKHISLSLALGFFVAFMPIWGFQTLTSIALSTLFKLNRVLSVAAASSSFFLLPFILFFGLKTGSVILDKNIQLTFDFKTITPDSVRSDFHTFAIGTLINGSIMFFCMLFVSLLILKLARQKKSVKDKN